MTQGSTPERSIVGRHRWPWLAIVGAGLMSVYLLLVAVDARHAAHLSTGDTNNLVQGSRALIDCVRGGDFVGCGRYEGSVQTTIFPYPLLQYLPASLLVWLKLDDLDVLTSLRWLNFASLVLVLALFAFAFWRRPRQLWLSWAVLIGSSLMYHANASFGEALAAAALLSAVVAAGYRRPVLVFALACLASLGKETFAPFVAVLCLVCSRTVDDRWWPQRRMVWSSVAGAVLGLVLSLWFNVLRFGGPRNALYLDPQLQTAGNGRRIEWFVALLFSPAGGLVWFWPGFMVVIVTGVVVAVRKPTWRERAIGLVPAAVLLGVLGGLALWFAPFGWITFGPRLAVPVLPAVLFAVLWTDGDRVVRALSSRVLAVVVVVAVPLLSLPLFGAPWRWFDSVLEMIRPDPPDCPAMTEFSVLDDSDTYYRCTSRTMWRLRTQILDDSVARGVHVSTLASALAVAGSFCLLAAALHVFGRRPSPNGDESAPPAAQLDVVRTPTFD